MIIFTFSCQRHPSDYFYHLAPSSLELFIVEANLAKTSGIWLNGSFPERAAGLFSAISSTPRPRPVWLQAAERQRPRCWWLEWSACCRLPVWSPRPQFPHISMAGSGEVGLCSDSFLYRTAPTLPQMNPHTLNAACAPGGTWDSLLPCGWVLRGRPCEFTSHPRKMEHAQEGAVQSEDGREASAGEPSRNRKTQQDANASQ